MEATEIKMNRVTPILRIFDVHKAKQFYLEFLEFTLDWEHRFEENMPLYMQVSCSKCLIHLSEHHGDCSPGSAIRIEVQNIVEFHAKIIQKKYPYSRPGLETTPWNTLEVCVTDPFGNRILFYEDIDSRDDSKV